MMPRFADERKDQNEEVEDCYPNTDVTCISLFLGAWMILPFDICT